MKIKRKEKANYFRIIKNNASVGSIVLPFPVGFTDAPTRN